MKIAIANLIEHLERFKRKESISLQWAKDAESILDLLEEPKEVLEELQHYLASYRPEGGPHLYNEEQMRVFLSGIIPILRNRMDQSQNEGDAS